MKQRMVYSPKREKIAENLDINFKKSPQKFILYDSPQAPPHLPYPQPYSPTLYVQTNQFNHIKKVSDESSSLRQTMNSKHSARLAKRHTLYEFQEQDQKPNKLNDFLRQTMSFRSTKAFSQKLGSDLTNSNEVTVRKEDIFNTYRGYKNPDSYRITESKSSSNLLEGQKSLDQCQLIHQKIDRNKKIIQQLRKGPSERKANYLRNVTSPQSPTFLDLDRQKQTDEKGFKKKTVKQPGYFMTPKHTKQTYDVRFKSSPLIQEPKQQSVPEQMAATLKIVSPLKKKKSLNIDPILESSPTDDYEIGKKLGQGKFGCVNLVRHKKTLGLFALKKIPKAMIKSHMMVEQLALEIRLQSCLQHRNILGMFGFFDDKTHLYIVLEYMDGGTLYDQLKKGKLTQDETAFVIRQMAEALEQLHDKGIAHRDLKPENIVICNDIYKLCDFGWAAMCNERRKTYCGTFDYVAPEILQGVDYDMTVDLWCLGVMTFELMTGKAPFYHISRKETMKRIKNVETQTIQYPEGMSDAAKDFIQKLIRKNPLERMKANQALLHPFIKDVELVN